MVAGNPVLLGPSVRPTLHETKPESSFHDEQKRTPTCSPAKESEAHI